MQDMFEETELTQSTEEPPKKVGKILPIILIISCLILAAVLIYPVIRQPEKVDGLAALNEAEASELSYIQVDVTLLSDTGVDYLVNDKVKGRYYYALEDDTCYLVRMKTNGEEEVPATYENVTITGMVYSDLTEKTDVIQGMSILMNCPSEAIREKTCEYMIRE